MDIKEILLSDDYNFLKDDKRLGDNIILLCTWGSHAYGTNVGDSDIDIRGIALNSRENILLGTDFSQVVDNKTDTVVYSFKKIIDLISVCNPNTIEMLGCREQDYLVKTKIGQEILNNKDMFLSKIAASSFGGYATQQLYRMSKLVPEMLENGGLEKHILRVLKGQIMSFGDKFAKIESDSLNLYVEECDGKHEIFMDMSLSHYPLRDYVPILGELQNTLKSYDNLGKRNKNAFEHGKLEKHMMHLIRLYYMCFDILEKGEINTYRGNEHELLMKIRGGEFIKDEKVLPEFFELVNELEKRLEYDKQNTFLPDKPDYDRIQEFKLDVCNRIVTGSI